MCHVEPHEQFCFAIDLSSMNKPRKYPIFRIPPDTSFPPHFSTGYLDANFFINVPVRKLVTPKKNGENEGLKALQKTGGVKEGVKVPATPFPGTPHSCDVERSFSIGKHVRFEKQHKAYVSFCFNGVVPPP